MGYEINHENPASYQLANYQLANHHFDVANRHSNHATLIFVSEKALV